MTNTPTRPETMVERLARAIHDELENDGDSGGGGYVRAARAAIEAMRSPTEDMMKAGCVSLDATTSSYDEPDWWLEETFHCWQAMINAALGDG